MDFKFSHNALQVTRESAVVMGDWWSGILRVVSKNSFRYQYALTWKDAEGSPHAQLFSSAESAEQFMDELDLNWGLPPNVSSF